MNIVRLRSLDFVTAATPTRSSADSVAKRTPPAEISCGYFAAGGCCRGAGCWFRHSVSAQKVHVHADTKVQEDSAASLPCGDGSRNLASVIDASATLLTDGQQACTVVDRASWLAHGTASPTQPTMAEF